MLTALRYDAIRHGNDARWLRNQYHRLGELPKVVEAMAHMWRGERLTGQSGEPNTTLRRRIRATSEPIADDAPSLTRTDPASLALWPGQLH